MCANGERVREKRGFEAGAVVKAKVVHWSLQHKQRIRIERL